MNILVLGSSGQIGKPLVQELRKKHMVFEWDIQNSHLEDLRIPSPSLRKVMIQCDFVFYLASDVGGAKYLDKYQNSADFIINNMKIMNNVFDILRKNNIPFIFTSSQMAELCHSTYGQLKSLGEKIVNDIGGLNVRLWNVYGPEPFSEKSHVITDFINMAYHKQLITCATDGQESRQMLYVDDCIQCMILLMNNYSIIDKNANYHITNFKWITIKEIATIVANQLNCSIHFTEKKDNTQRNMMNDPDPYILKLWKPLVSIEKGIDNMIKSYMINNKKQ